MIYHLVVSKYEDVLNMSERPKDVPSIDDSVVKVIFARHQNDETEKCGVLIGHKGSNSVHFSIPSGTLESSVGRFVSDPADRVNILGVLSGGYNSSAESVGIFDLKGEYHTHPGSPTPSIDDRIDWEKQARAYKEFQAVIVGRGREEGVIRIRIPYTWNFIKEGEDPIIIPGDVITYRRELDKLRSEDRVRQIRLNELIKKC